VERWVIREANIAAQNVQNNAWLSVGQHRIGALLARGVTANGTTRTEGQVAGIAQRPRDAAAQHQYGEAIMWIASPRIAGAWRQHRQKEMFTT
jgi:hypothetical protein